MINYGKRIAIRLRLISYVVYVLIGVLYAAFWLEFGATPFLWWAIKAVLFPFFAFYFVHSLKNLYYSFWAFAFFIFTYILIGIVQSLFYYSAPTLTILYQVALIILAGISYILFHPHFFPLVDWWEYDFRFRTDLKVFAIYKDQKIEGRITDIRRNGLGIAFFESIDVDSLLTLHWSKHEDKEIMLRILSKKKSFIGRETLYGASFYAQTKERKANKRELIAHWIQNKKDKREKKYEESAT